VGTKYLGQAWIDLFTDAPRRIRSISPSIWCGSMRCVSALRSSMSPATQTLPLASPAEIRVALILSSLRDGWGKLLALAVGWEFMVKV